MFINLLAAVAFYLFPVLLGISFTKRIIPGFFVGCLIIYLTYILTFLSFSFLGIQQNFSVYAAYFLSAGAVGSLIYNAKLLRTSTLELFSQVKNNLQDFSFYFLTFTSLFLLYLVIWRGTTPYPLVLNWDFFEHLTVINQLSLNQFSLLGTRLTDTFTFNSYTTFFHVLLTLPITLFKTDLLGVYWWIEMIHYLLTIAVSGLLAKKLFHTKAVAILAMIITGLVFESSIIYRSFFFIPQTFTAFLSMLLLYEIVSQKIQNRLFIALGFLALFLMHFIIGPVSILINLGWLLVSHFRRLLNFNLFLNITLAGLFFSIVLNFLPGVDLTQREEATHLLITPWEKAVYFLHWYGFLLPILVGLNIFLYKRLDNFNQKMILLTGLNLAALAVLPVAYFMKFYVLAGYFINISLAFGLYYLASEFKPIFRWLIYGWVILCLFIVFYLNQLSFKNPFYFEGNHSHISQSEMEAALWIRTNFDQKTTFLISDPGSQYVFESLSLVNSQGGSYMNEQTRQKLIGINWSNDSQSIKNNLQQIEDTVSKQKIEKRLFIIGGRYFAWQKLPADEKMSVYFNVWRPHKIDASDYSYINFMTKNFKVLYQNNEIIILEI